LSQVKKSPQRTGSTFEPPLTCVNITDAIAVRIAT